ncbi:hypothetical protein B0J14DRAFT_685819 [Halenospora varia]|nr:hypothetical protein B0J14DRAFT_685819 [Halenospora varia]
MTTKLTEVIRDDISSLPRWPRFVEDQQQKLRAEATSARAPRYKQLEKSALRNKEFSAHPQSTPDAHAFVDEYAQEYATKLAEMEEALWESVSFRVMDDRENDISDAELRTFE